MNLFFRRNEQLVDQLDVSNPWGFFYIKKNRNHVVDRLLLLLQNILRRPKTEKYGNQNWISDDSKYTISHLQVSETLAAI